MWQRLTICVLAARRVYICLVNYTDSEIIWSHWLQVRQPPANTSIGQGSSCIKTPFTYLHTLSSILCIWNVFNASPKLSKHRPFSVLPGNVLSLYYKAKFVWGWETNKAVATVAPGDAEKSDGRFCIVDHMRQAEAKTLAADQAVNAWGRENVPSVFFIEICAWGEHSSMAFLKWKFDKTPHILCDM